jgi:hypothetical protein
VAVAVGVSVGGNGVSVAVAVAVGVSVGGNGVSVAVAVTVGVSVGGNGVSVSVTVVVGVSVGGNDVSVSVAVDVRVSVGVSEPAKGENGPFLEALAASALLLSRYIDVSLFGMKLIKASIHIPKKNSSAMNNINFFDIFIIG